VAAGYHPLDKNSLPRPSRPYREALDSPLPRLRIAFSRDLGYARVQRDVAAIVDEAVDEFRRMGHVVEDVGLALPDLGLAWAYMCGAQDWAELGDVVKGRESEMGRGYWSGIEAAKRLTWQQHGEFQRQRTELNLALMELFSRYDLLLTPTLPTEAFAARGPMPREIDGVRLESPMHAVAFMYPFNMSGHPAATLRAGFTKARLPVGLQIVAERHRDELVLQAAGAFERVRPMDEWPL
jgi:aspartyl-tRNA(Asn)/glutamyl-tRNA(Gln) amidotransferase subunit A